MSEIKQPITLEQAAQSYYDKEHVHSLQTIDAFKAGAEWQKEQYKNLLNLAAIAASNLEPKVILQQQML